LGQFLSYIISLSPAMFIFKKKLFFKTTHMRVGGFHRWKLVVLHDKKKVNPN
jgi:hypothetical protein